MTLPSVPAHMQRHAALLVPPWTPLWCVQMGEIVPQTRNGTHESRWNPGTECRHEHLPVLIAVPRRGMYPGMVEYEPPSGNDHVGRDPVTDSKSRSQSGLTSESRPVTRWRKRPVEIEALQWRVVNHEQIKGWLGDAYLAVLSKYVREKAAFLSIRTLEGQLAAAPGDWIVKGIQGEFYPVKPDIFAATYELVENTEEAPDA